MGGKKTCFEKQREKIVLLQILSYMNSKRIINGFRENSRAHREKREQKKLPSLKSKANLKNDFEKKKKKKKKITS